MKFGDVVIAVASLTVISVLLYFVLLGVFVTVNSYWATDVASIGSTLVASFVVGYLFAAKMYEVSRIRAIGKIVVLYAVVVAFFMMALFANPYMDVAMKETLESMFSTGGWTTWDWVAYSQFVMVMLVAVNMIFAMVFSFIGLYVGSMLRKPQKS